MAALTVKKLAMMKGKTILTHVLTHNRISTSGWGSISYLNFWQTFKVSDFQALCS